MATIRINGIKLKRAIGEFGSIQKAVEALQTEKLELDKYNSELKRENAQLKLDRDKLTAEVKTIQDQLAIKVKQLELLTERAKEYGHQYELFEDFVVMLATSPSVTGSVTALVALFQNLLAVDRQR
jgi:chromosome segregation ATPase